MSTKTRTRFAGDTKTPVERPKRVIRAKAPLRISFGGGGTDLESYFMERGGCVVSSAIRKYAYCTIVSNGAEEIHAKSHDYNAELTYRLSEQPGYDGKLDLIKAAVKVVGVREGLDLQLHSDVPPGTGLGSSSATCVALLGALKRFQDQPYTLYDLADLAYRVEREEVGIKGGKQDQYACAFGGFNFIEFLGNSVVVNPLPLSADMVNELEYRCILCDTGTARLSAGIITDQVGRYTSRQPDTVKALDQTKGIALRLRDLLLLGKLDELGRTLHEAWQIKRRFSPLISNRAIDELYQIGLNAGALGGKILGAGGGGYLLFLCAYDKRHHVVEKLKGVGAEVSSVSFEPQGVQIWEAPHLEESHRKGS